MFELLAFTQLQVEDEARYLKFLAEVLNFQLSNLGMDKHHELPRAAKQETCLNRCSGGASAESWKTSENSLNLSSSDEEQESNATSYFRCSETVKLWGNIHNKEIKKNQDTLKIPTGLLHRHKGCGSSSTISKQHHKDVV